MWTWFLSNPMIMFRLAMYYVCKVVDGLATAGSLWSNSKLLGVVEECLRGDKKVEASEAWRIGVIAVTFHSLPDLVKILSTKSNEKLKFILNASVEGAFLEAKLSSTISDASDPTRGSLLLEGGLFSTHIPEEFDFLWSRVQFPSQLNSHVGSTLRNLVALSSQLVLLIRVLGEGDRLFTLTSGMILLLAFAPLVAQWFRPKRNIYNDFFFNPHSRAANRYKNFGFEYSFKPEIILFSLKQWILERWRSSIEPAIKEYSWSNDGPMASEVIVSSAVHVAFHLILATRSAGGSLSLSTLNLYQQAASGVTTAFQTLRDDLKSLYAGIFIGYAFQAAILEQPNSKSQEDYEALRDHDAAGMRIEVRDLSFTHPGGEKAVLHNINLVIEAGETLAIVGFNGGGKSTLVKVLLGLYDDHDGLKGEHLINGLPPSHYDQETLYARTSCVFQDFAKYNASVRENVGVGDTRRIQDDDTLRAAMERGGATKILDDNGFESFLKAGNEYADYDDDQDDNKKTGGLSHLARGAVSNKFDEERKSSWNYETKRRPTDLSGGQWQRIALSRAFMRADKADLVVFDEPSASLDPRAEAELFDRIHSLATGAEGKRTTTIYVSHRFSTVRRADKIAFVDGGTIVEYGNHSELMALKGQYYELFSLQRKGFSEE